LLVCLANTALSSGAIMDSDIQKELLRIAGDGKAKTLAKLLPLIRSIARTQPAR
jgi:hypothetical protein